ncbi:MAG: PD40 domain-containing protein [Proteobacteria bacterium]|nr:PD40 domain-containing protein [Pseudomonadota bacterium]
MTPSGNQAGLLRVLAAAAFLTLAALPATAGEVKHTSTGHAENPVWSASGAHLAFEVNPLGGNIDLFVSEVTGGAAKSGRQITLPGGGSGFGGGKRVAVNSSWHPSGFVVFEATNSSGEYRLYFSQPPAVTASELRTQAQAPGSLQYPSISSTGNEVVFTSSATGKGDIQLWEPNTDSTRNLTSTPGTEVFPSFSPNGSELVFTRKNNGGEDVFLVDVASGAEKAVAGGGGDQTRPAFAMGGSRIVFFSKASGASDWDLVSVAANGSDKKTLATQVRLPSRARPAISPDGNWVAFGSVEGSGITLVKADGSQTVTVETGHRTVGEPAMAMSAGRLMLAYTGLISTDADWRRLYVVDITGQI